MYNGCIISREDEYLATKMQHTVIPSWYQRKGYIIANANLIEMELQKFKFPDEVHTFGCLVFVLFTLHLF